MSFRSTFTNKEKDEAKFWAWLTNRYVIPFTLLEELKIEDLDADYLLSTRDEIKKYVSLAFQKGNHTVADKLFDLIQTNEDDENLVRKSMRVGKGEYIALYCLKLSEEISFSKILIKILTEPVVEFLEEFYETYGNSLSDKLQHLLNVTNKWYSDTPEPRIRDVDWNINDIYDYFFTEHKFSDLSNELSTFLLMELRIKESLDYLEDGPSDIFKEFSSEWEKQVFEKYFMKFELIPFVNEGCLELTLYHNSYAVIDEQRERELFFKYEDHPVISFIQRFHLEGGESSEGEYYGLNNSNEQFKQVLIGAKITIGKYKVITKSSKEIEIQIDEDYYKITLSKYKEKFNQLKKIFLILNKIYDRKEIEKIDLDQIHIEWEELISNVIDKGDPYEYNIVSTMFKINNIVRNLRVIIERGKQYIEREVIKYPVISYYINKDLSLVLPIVLKEHNLYKLIKKYENS